MRCISPFDNGSYQQMPICFESTIRKQLNSCFYESYLFRCIGEPSSILGPLLFVLFINDLPDTIPTDIHVALYADDTKAYNSVKSEDDAQHLQQALSSLDNWSTRNNLKFNESKCKVLTIIRKKHPTWFNRTA